MSFLQRLFDTSDFPARWSCGQWSPELGWLHIASDLLIFLAYFAIPASLAVFAIRRKDFPFSAILFLFMAFILACGTTHLIEATIFWKPVYRLSGLAKAITAVISVTTAIVLIRALPSLLALPGLRGANTDLRSALSREELARAELTTARDTLERRTSEMTQRIRRISTAFAASKCVACRWEAESGAIDWQIGLAEASRRIGMDSPGAFGFFEEILVEEDAAKFREAVRLSIESGSPLDFQGRLAAQPDRAIRLSATPEPEVEGQPRYLSGMFRFL
jgi:hypothetical protein